MGEKDFLYLFAHCATKTMNESVIEGMGSFWDASSQPSRHPNFETGVEEAVIAYSAPHPWHASTDTFVTHTLNDMFGGRAWNFTHTNERTDQLTPWSAGSVVLTRLHNEYAPRLPSAFYDSPVPHS